MYRLSEVNDMAFDMFYDHEIVVHGSTSKIRMNQITKAAKCPECGCTFLHAGSDNYIQYINNNKLYFYHKGFSCEKCHCEFNYRVTNILENPYADFKTRLLAFNIITIIVSIFFAVLAIFTSLHIVFAIISGVLYFGSLAVTGIIREKEPPEPSHTMDDAKIEKEEILRSDIDYEETQNL
jgi:hypothetical protein